MSDFKRIERLRQRYAMPGEEVWRSSYAVSLKGSLLPPQPFPYLRLVEVSEGEGPIEIIECEVVLSYIGPIPAINEDGSVNLECPRYYYTSEFYQPPTALCDSVETAKRWFKVQAASDNEWVEVSE